MSQPEREAQFRGDVVDTNGIRARIESFSPADAAGGGHALLRAENNFTYVVPRDALVELKEGGYFLSLSLRDLTPHDAAAGAAQTRNATTATRETPAADGGAARTDDEVLVIPVVEEALRVGRRTVERGRVRITKRVVEREEIVDQPTRSEEPVVERVPVNRVVESAPPVRYEGDVMIVPLVEEVLVVERRLMLREELRISKRQVETNEPQRVILRREEAIVERIAPGGAGQSATEPSERDERRTTL